MYLCYGTGSDMGGGEEGGGAEEGPEAAQVAPSSGSVKLMMV